LQGPKVDPVNPLHDQVIGAVVAAEIVDLHDIGMGEFRANPGLLDEHINVVAQRAKLRADAFDRDGALKSRRTANHRAVHGCHSAFTGDLDKLILAVDQRAVRHSWQYR
jgi:hypothetical protein